MGRCRRIEDIVFLHLDKHGVKGHITRAEEIMSIMDTYEHENRKIEGPAQSDRGTCSESNSMLASTKD